MQQRAALIQTYIAIAASIAVRQQRPGDGRGDAGITIVERQLRDMFISGPATPGFSRRAHRFQIDSSTITPSKPRTIRLIQSRSANTTGSSGICPRVVSSQTLLIQ